MLNQLRARPARLSCVENTGQPAGLDVGTDPARAPVSFCWHAHTGSGRRSKYFHIVTLERLQMKAGDAHGQPAVLVPSAQFNISSDDLRRWLADRSFAILPRLPDGYGWIGPVLIQDTSPEEAAALLARATPCLRINPALREALPLARKVLHEIEMA